MLMRCVDNEQVYCMSGQQDQEAVKGMTLSRSFRDGWQR